MVYIDIIIVVEINLYTLLSLKSVFKGFILYQGMLYLKLLENVKDYT